MLQAAANFMSEAVEGFIADLVEAARLEESDAPATDDPSAGGVVDPMTRRLDRDATILQPSSAGDPGSPDSSGRATGDLLPSLSLLGDAGGYPWRGCGDASLAAHEDHDEPRRHRHNSDRHNSDAESASQRQPVEARHRAEHTHRHRRRPGQQPRLLQLPTATERPGPSSSCDSFQTVDVDADGASDEGDASSVDSQTVVVEPRPLTRDRRREAQAYSGDDVVVSSSANLPLAAAAPTAGVTRQLPPRVVATVVDITNAAHHRTQRPQNSCGAISRSAQLPWELVSPVHREAPASISTPPMPVLQPRHAPVEDDYDLC